MRISRSHCRKHLINQDRRLVNHVATRCPFSPKSTALSNLLRSNESSTFSPALEPTVARRKGVYVRSVRTGYGRTRRKRKRGSRKRRKKRNRNLSRSIWVDSSLAEVLLQRRVQLHLTLSLRNPRTPSHHLQLLQQRTRSLQTLSLLQLQPQTPLLRPSPLLPLPLRLDLKRHL